MAQAQTLPPQRSLGILRERGGSLKEDRGKLEGNQPSRFSAQPSAGTTTPGEGDSWALPTLSLLGQCLFQLGLEAAPLVFSRERISALRA
jgi:hypothetical protein